jgi:ribonucleoside-diphosphate reductase alpha chain
MNRPKITQSETHRIITSCGSLYVTLGRVNEKPIEVFITMGKSGACETCQNAALGIALSIALQYGTPLDKLAENLRGIRCPKPVLASKEDRVLSCADAVSGILFLYVEKEQEQVVKTT